METSGGETTEVQKDSSLRKEKARRGLSLAPISSPLRCFILVLAHVLLFKGQNKASAVWPTAQDVGTEIPLVLLVKRDLHTSDVQVLATIQRITKDLTRSFSQGNRHPIPHCLEVFDNELN